ncbi:TPA: hypothetical protein ACG3DQ_005133, partial [Pseudomonas putida]
PCPPPVGAALCCEEAGKAKIIFGCNGRFAAQGCPYRDLWDVASHNSSQKYRRARFQSLNKTVASTTAPAQHCDNIAVTLT